MTNYPDLDLIRLDADWLKARHGFITGATGWIGSWVCQALDSIGASYTPLIHTEYQDIENFAIPYCNYIIHLSHGKIKRVIEAAKRNKCPVLFASSGAVYQEPLDRYGRTKLQHECQFISAGIETKIARIFTLAGAGVPSDKKGALGCFIDDIKHGRDIRLWGDGAEVRTYLYMADLVTWLFKILIDGERNRSYDVGAREEITLLDLARYIRGKVGACVDIVIENSEVNPRRYYVPGGNALGVEISVPLYQAIDRTIEYELPRM